jgi:hypothetical protein
VTSEDRASRLTWLDSPAALALLFVAAALWTYYLVAAFVNGAYLLAALDALALMASGWTIARILRRRPRRTG